MKSPSLLLHFVPLAALALTDLAPAALAQAETIYEYNAGLAGNPSIAPSPVTQGWSQSGSGTPTTFQPVSPDGNTGLNAWQISDLNTTAGSVGRYLSTFTASQVDDAAQYGFRLDVDMRMLASGSARSIYFEYTEGTDPSDERYLVYLQISGLDVSLEPFNGTPRICPLAMDGEYHQFSILHAPGAALAELLFDGAPVGNFAPIAGGGIPQGGVAFGAGSSLGSGAANFHRVRFGVLRPDVGSRYCSPAHANSTGEPAIIQATGSNVASENDVVLYARQLPPNQFGYFLNGTQPGYVANPGGSRGDLCLGGTLGRYIGQVQFSGTLGEMSISLDLMNTPTSSGHVAILSGETWRFQCWFRDNHPQPTSNLTDGVRVTFQ